MKKRITPRHIIELIISLISILIDVWFIWFILSNWENEATRKAPVLIMYGIKCLVQGAILFLQRKHKRKGGEPLIPCPRCGGKYVRITDTEALGIKPLHPFSQQMTQSKFITTYYLIAHCLECRKWFKR